MKKVERTRYPECGTDKELLHLIKARHTIIYVVTWEEQRVIDALDAICERKDVFLCGVQVWDAARGLKSYCGTFTPPDGEDLENPEEMINYIIAKAEETIEGDTESKSKDSRGPIYVLCDLFRYLGPKLTPVLERKLKYLAHLLKQTSINVIITSPELILPCTLEKCITVVDYPFPEAAQLTTLVDAIKRKVLKRDRVTAEDASVPTEAIVRACLGLTFQEAEDAIAKAIVKTNKFDIPTILEVKKQIIRKGGILDFVETTDTMDEVGGLEGIKHWIKIRKDCLSNKAREYGLPHPKGIFLLGLQGTGKSLCAKAVANEMQISLLKLDIGKCMNSYVGESESNIRRALKLAESVAPCVMFIDELDMNASGGSAEASDNTGVSKRIVATLLDWMQERKAPVFIVAAANSTNGLPPAMLRRGRFDELFFVDLPNEVERKAIFEIHLKKPRGTLNRTRNPVDFDVSGMVAATPGFSGAEIEAVIIDAMNNAFADGGREFNTADVMDAISTCKPLSYFLKDVLKKLREDNKGRMRPASEVKRSLNDSDRFDYLGDAEEEK